LLAEVDAPGKCARAIDAGNKKYFIARAD